MKQQLIGRLRCLFVCILFFLSGCGGQNETVLENPGVKVTYFNVGKGDTILIETQEHTMLIDAGYDNTYRVIWEYLTKQKIQKLDYFVITHFDKDHVGGADWIVKNFEVGEILQPHYQSDAKQYLEYCAAVEMMGLQPVPVTETLEFSLDGADFYINPPQKTFYKEEDNDFSLVVSMDYKEKSFLFAGDCEEERLSELLNQTDWELSHDVLKVPHHGKKEDNSEEFLNAVAPEAAVITCSAEEPASDKICDMLKELGAKIYFTSDGTVVCLCDGESLEIIQD